MNENKHEKIEDLNLVDFFSILFQRKLTIFIPTIIAAVLSVIFSLSLPNIYISSATLAPSSPSDSLSSKLGSLSAFAGLAGVSLPSNDSNKSIEAIARIRSFDFFKDQFLPNIKLENLMAADEWEPKSDIIKYNDTDYIKESDTWVRDVKFPFKPKPSNQEAFKVYSKIINLNEDKKTFFVTLSVEHLSPKVAAAWTKLIFNEINSYMRDIDISIAEESIKFLKKSSQSNNISDIQTSISELLKDQLQNLMFTESRKDYIFSYIESPYAPEKKSKPSRALICILGTFLGGIIGAIASLILNYRELAKNN